MILKWTRLVGIFFVGALVIGPGLLLGSWKKVADRVCMEGVEVILTVDGDFVAGGQELDFGPMKKWTPEFPSMGGPGALVNRTWDLAGIMDDDGNFEVYRIRGEINGNTVDMCSRMAGKPTLPRGGGGTPCPGPHYNFNSDCR